MNVASAQVGGGVDDVSVAGNPSGPGGPNAGVRWTSYVSGKTTDDNFTQLLPREVTVGFGCRGQRCSEFRTAHMQIHGGTGSEMVTWQRLETGVGLLSCPQHHVVTRLECGGMS